MAKKLPAKKKSPEQKRKELITTAVEAVQRENPFSAGYQAIPHILLRQPRDLPPFNFATIHAMLIDPEVRLNIAKRAAPIMKAEFGFKQGETWTEGIQCAEPEIGQYIYRQLQKIWSFYLPALLRSQVWGWSAGEVTVKLSDAGLVEIDKLHPRHASDSRILLQDKAAWGVRFQRVKESDSGMGYVDLQFPYCWFHSYCAEDGDPYGVSALLGCYSPWASKWFNGGALDVRTLFMHKDAYGGTDLGYPDGETLVNGQYMPNYMIARQIVEQLASGGVTTRPSKRDENGNEQWPLTRAVVASNPQHILQYPKDLDAEIRSGLEVPEEDGDAWASKRVTQAAFYASLDHWVVQLICDLKEQILDNLVLLNFGHIPEYEIKHKPLAEQAMEQQSNAGPGAQQGDPNASGMQDPNMGAPDQQPQQPGIPQVQPAPSPDQSMTPQAMSLAGLVNRAREVIRLSVNTDVDPIESDDTKDKGGEYAFDHERLDAMAEILASIFGDQAEEMLDTIIKPKRMAVWSPSDHPRGPNGRFVPKGTAEAYALAKDKVAEAHRNRSPETMQALMEHMNTLTISQLHDLRRDYGAKGSAKTKEALIAKLSSRLTDGRSRTGRRDNDTPTAPVREEVYSVPTKALKVDPSRFQYKVKGINKEEGVGEELKGTSKWNPELGGVLLVWRDPDSGQDYVVNGHHRHELARRTGTDSMNVRYIDAPTSRAARAVGALANIAEGRGTALDAAKYLRDSDRGLDHFRDAGISLSGKVASDAGHLINLSPRAFQKVAQGQIDEDKAVAVAKYLKDDSLQDKLFKRLADREDDGKDWSLREIETAAKKMANAGSVHESGTDLFGDWEDEKSTFDQEVEIESFIGKQLAQEANDYSAVANTRRAERVADAGNTLAVDENARRRDNAREHANSFDREASLKGPVSEAIKRHAADLASAKNKKQRDEIKRKALDDVRDILHTPKPVIVMPSKSNDDAEPGDQLGLFGESAKPKRDSATIDVGPEGPSSGKQKALFDHTGNPDQMDFWGDGVMPSELVAKQNRRERSGEAIAMSVSKWYSSRKGEHSLSDEEAESVEHLVREIIAGREADADDTIARLEDENAALRMALDKTGHDHKGKGPGGGQFTKKGNSDENQKSTPQQTQGKQAGSAPAPAGKTQPSADATPNDKPQPIKPVADTKVDSEPITPPPPGDAFKVDVEKTGPDGVAITARVGVPGRVVPPPPQIPQLPNLTKAERQAESDFMNAFTNDPDGVAENYRQLIAKTDKPYTFETDQAKVLSKDWCDPDLDTQMKKRQLYNNALHQTANAIVKRAFLKHLDTLQQGDSILVTVGGCGSGKGYTLKNTELGKNLTAEAKAVWDSAGDQNATENPWILEEAKKRGLTVTYAYVAGDPKVSWADPNRGVVKRAHDNKDGRMVDAAVFADSYVLGAKNHHAFHQANMNDPAAKFLFFSAKDQSVLPGVPEESLNWDRKSLYHWAMGSIQSRTDVAPTVMRGATSGARIWNDEF